MKERSEPTMPATIKKHSLSVEIDADLFFKVKTEAKKRRLKLWQIVEQGFEQFLKDCEK